MGSLEDRNITIQKTVVLTIIFSVLGLLAVGLLLITIGLLTGSMVDSIFPNATPSEEANISLSLLAMFLNSALTGGLIWIYLRQIGVMEEQTSISEEQTSIQERQQEIMEAEYIPAVDITVSEVSTDSITIACSNQGTGLAKQFEIDVKFYIGKEAVEGPADYDMGVEVEPLVERVFETTKQDTPVGDIIYRANYKGSATTPKRVTAEGDLPQTRTEEILRESESQDLEFSLYFERHVDPVDHHWKRCSFSDGIEELQNQGAKTLGFRISISYQDIFDNKVDSRTLATGWTDIQNGCSMEQMLENSEKRTIITHRQPSFGDGGGISLRNSEKVYRTAHRDYL